MFGLVFCYVSCYFILCVKRNEMHQLPWYSKGGFNFLDKTPKSVRSCLNEKGQGVEHSANIHLYAGKQLRTPNLTHPYTFEFYISS